MLLLWLSGQPFDRPEAVRSRGQANLENQTTPSDLLRVPLDPSPEPPRGTDFPGDASSDPTTGGKVDAGADSCRQLSDAFIAWAGSYITNHSGAQSPEELAVGETLALRRRQALKELIQSDPAQALQCALPWRLRAQLPASIERHLEERISGRGFFGVIVSDDFDTGTAALHREVRIDGKTWAAYVYGRRVRQNTQRDVFLHGIAIDGLMAVHEDPLRRLDPDEEVANPGDLQTCALCGASVSPQGAVLADVGDRVVAACSEPHFLKLARQLAGDEGGLYGNGGELLRDSWTQGPKRLLYMRVAFPEDPTEPIKEDEARNVMNDVNTWYVENSYGTTAIISDVTPLLMLPQTKDWYGVQGSTRLLSDARETARAAGFDTDNYDLDVVRHNRVPGYNWNGQGYVGTKGVWLQTSSLGVAVHELGHNYGLLHANFWNATGDGVIGAGSNAEYGDVYDTMGTSSAGNCQFNVIGKNRLDWLPAGFFHMVTNSGCYRVYAFDVPQLVSSFKYGLRIRKDFDRDYWAEFRQKFTSNPWTQSGILLHWDSWDNGAGSSAGGTHLLDTTPGTPAGNSSKDDAAVVLGRTFSDPSVGIHITPLAKGGTAPDTWIDVQVNLGFFPDNAPPTLQIEAEANSVPINVPVNFMASASDNDGDTLAYWWDFGDLTFGSNAPTASKKWSAAGEYVVRCAVSDMKGGVASRFVVVTVGSPATYRVAGRITDASDQPIEGVRVHNGLTGSSYRGTYTDSDGQYVLVGLASSTYTLAAVKYGFTPQPLGWTNPVAVNGDLTDLNWTGEAKPTVSLTATDAVAREQGLDPATVTLSRTGPTTSSLTVNYMVTGTASLDMDYSLSPPLTTWPIKITLPAGVSATNLVVTPIDDTDNDGPETVVFSLAESPNYVIGPDAEVATVIEDDETAVQPTVYVTAQTLREESDSLMVEGRSDSGAFAFERRGSVAGDLTIYYSVSGSAQNGVDYTPLSGMVTIPAGGTKATVAFTAIDDLAVEGNETVVVTIVSSAAYLAGQPNSAQAIIVDDDPPTVTIAATDKQAIENSSNTGRFTVTRIGNLAANLLVNYMLSGTAVAGVDYNALPGTVLLPAGQATATIAVTPINDSLAEGDETMVATLTSSPAYNVGNPGEACVVILDDELPTVTLSASDATAAEPGTDTAAFTFTRTGSTTDPLTVLFDVSGTALNGVDYAAIPSSIEIPAGTNSLVVPITALDDTVREKPEQIILVLKESPNYNRGTTATQTVTINDDDVGGTVGVRFAMASSSGMENATTVQIPVVLSTNSSSSVSVGYTVVGGTAASGQDYSLSSGTLTFAANETTKSILFSVTDDALAEPNETIVVNLLNPSNAMLDSLTSHTYTIVDNDASGNVTISAVTPNGSEAGSQGLFRISRSGSTSADLTVLFQVTGTASSPSDYQPLGNFCIIPAGQSSVNLAVTPVDDSIPEPPETVTVELVSAAGGRIGSPSTATVTIADNDSADGLPIVSVVADDPVAAEPGADTGLFVISRDRGTNAPLTVNFTVGGTAASSVDYDSVGTMATIPAGAWSVPVSLVPRDDTTLEGNETVVLTLTAQGTTRVSPQAGAATITIMDNEVGVSVVSSGITSEDGSSIGAFVVSRVGSTDSSITVTLSVGGTAINGVDYDAIPNSVTFPAGTNMVWLDVVPRVDTAMEGTETVLLSLVAAAGYTLIAPTNAAVFVLDSGTDIPPAIVVEPVDQLATEGCDATFSVTAAGTPPLFYQWFFNATNLIAAGTNSVLVIENVQDSNAGLYSVVISNFLASVTSSNAALVVNHRPVPASPEFQRYPAAGLKKPMVALLGSDPDGDTLFLSSVAVLSAQGAAVTTDQGWVMYLPPAGLTNDDSFDYIVGDGRGGFSTGTVTITVVTNMEPSLNLTWLNQDEGSVCIAGDGIPGRNYTIEFTESLSEPDWQPLSTLQTDEFGRFDYVDWPPAGSPARFYRATAP